MSNITLYAQSQCFCEGNQELNEALLERSKVTLQYTNEDKPCKIKQLKNGNLLYYQYNCDSTWLIFENTKTKNKIILFSKETEQHAHSYREGYKLHREFKNFLLMSWHSKPSLYVLIDKQTGQKIDEIKSILVFNSIDDNKKETNFIVYFENNKTKFIIIHNLENNTKRKIRFPKNILMNVSVYPEEECDKKNIDIQNILILTFYSGKVFKINLNN
ncbi:MAG: hypothetical protein EAY69_00185 [Cytophagales bacterium]|nr:MAG: hypothetical protein EAY69_00185 [Cytophagales bacterium]